MRKMYLFSCLQVVVLLMAITGFCAETAPLKKRAKPGVTGVKQARSVKTLSKRVALVIGNSQYAATTLKTPVNDAHALAATLRRLGFVVEEKSNLGRAELKKTIVSFGQRLKGSEVGLFFFAGHGIQVQGQNFLLPIDAKIQSEQDVKDRAIAAELVMEVMQEAKSGVNVVILDASRDNPVGSDFHPTSSGLAIMVPPPGTIVATATATGMTTIDGGSKIGTYTQALITALDTPGYKIADILAQVRTEVVDKTGKAQIPWEYSSFIGDFLLVPPFNPSGSGLQKTHDSVRNEGEARDAQPSRVVDALTGMELMPVQGGCFPMGDTFDNGLFLEKPVHVACVNDFFIGKYEVTQGQWRRVMGDNPAHFSKCGDDCPVEQVSWDDVQKFIRKLNRQTGGQYRLPTEAEWEYAARSGGKREMFSGGGDADVLAWNAINSGGMTRRVGTKQANGLGIYDLSGNVWEWVQDWYGSYTNGRQVNPPGPTSGFFRVFRGGSWSQQVENSRASIRFYNVPETRTNFVGFRLARSAFR